MFTALAAWLYKLAGWKTIGRITTLPKAIWVVAPHNSNWDFLVGIGVRALIRKEIQYLAKKELFAWYSDWFFRGLGGVPVNRHRSSNLVDAVAEVFQEHDQLHIAVAPEGTRGNVSRLKTGFYYMALKAKVPLVLVGFDYPRKAVVFRDPFFPTGEYEKDMITIYEFYRTIQGPHKDWLRKYEEGGVIA